MNVNKTENNDMTDIVRSLDRVFCEKEKSASDFMSGKDVLVYVKHFAGCGGPGERLLTSIIEKAEAEDGGADFELRFVKPDDNETYVWLKTRIDIIERGSGSTLVTAGFKDVTTEKTIEKNQKSRQIMEALEAANRDKSTGVYNKFFTEEIIRHRLSENDRRLCMLFILDIDYLKDINDTYGHPVGDKVIEKVAAIIRGCIRGGDMLGRIGGDEFMGLVCCIPDEATARLMIERMLTAVSGTKVCDCEPSVSIGCVMTEAGREDFDSLYRKADKALYHVKRNSKNNYDFYTSEND